MQQEIEELKKRISVLERNLGGVGLGEDNLSDAKVMKKPLVLKDSLEMSDGKNIKVGSGTGTKLGENSTDKLAFLGGTPRVQYTPGGAATASGTYGGTEQNMIQNAYDCLRAFGLLA